MKMSVNMFGSRRLSQAAGVGTAGSEQSALQRVCRGGPIRRLCRCPTVDCSECSDSV